MARKRREAKKTDFDLTPMIDVTFQLLIFFIVTMKIKQKERRQQADLPTDEGPAPSTEQEPKDFIVIRLFWRENEMVYEVNFKHGNDMGKNPSAVRGGPMSALMADRGDPNHVTYRNIFENLMGQVKEKVARTKNCEKFEITLANSTTISSVSQIDQTAPWGFVTLVVDVLTKFNMERQEKGEKPFSITFKNTMPGGVPGK